MCMRCDKLLVRHRYLSSQLIVCIKLQYFERLHNIQNVRICMEKTVQILSLKIRRRMNRNKSTFKLHCFVLYLYIVRLKTTKISLNRLRYTRLSKVGLFSVFSHTLKSFVFLGLRI